MAATTLSMKEQMAWSRCVRLAEAARWSEPGTSLGVQGMAAQMAARGHALDGEADDAHCPFDEGQGLICRASEHAEEEPVWMYFDDDTWLAALHLRGGRLWIRSWSGLPHCRTSVDATRPGTARASRTHSPGPVSLRKLCQWLWRASRTPPTSGVRTRGTSCTPGRRAETPGSGGGHAVGCRTPRGRLNGPY